MIKGNLQRIYLILNFYRKEMFIAVSFGGFWLLKYLIANVWLEKDFL